MALLFKFQHTKSSALKIAFIGCGNMAQSLIGGMIANGTSGRNVIVADPSDVATAGAAKKWNVTVAANNKDAVADARVVVIAVKPQQMKNVLTDIADQLTDQLLVSIAAGILTKDILAWSQATGTQQSISVVRCMPNTPALLQCGATGLFADSSVTDEQRTIADGILKAVGVTAWVEQEPQLDAITALSGSGPAYFFLMIEAMTQAATELGLSESMAQEFATQTALGAARMAAESDLAPAQLRKNVTSPAGTTEAALESFNSDNFKQIVLHAMQAADKRAVELGRELGSNTND